MATVDKIDVDGAGVHVEDGKAVGSTGESLSIEEDNRLLRKIDRCLLPVMAISYFFQFLDKTALSYTSILGIQQDLHLDGNEYSWSSSIYYIGYLAGSYPAAILMVRWRVGKLIAITMLLWGAILMLTAVCFNSRSLLANRLFLGVAESPIAPGLTIIISMWYKRSEQPLRHAAWFLGNTFAGMLGSLVAYGIGHIQGIAAWKAVFLIFGGITIVWSAGIFFLLPDTPLDSWFLNTSDQPKAILRVKENMTCMKSNTFEWYQCIEALLDAKTWLIFMMQILLCIPNGGVTTFSAIIVKGFGFTTVNTLLLISLAYVLQLFLVLLATFGCSYFANSRTYWMAWNFAIAITGAVLVRQLPVHMQWGRLSGVCMSGAYGANFPLIMSLVSGNVCGFTKKTTVNAISFIGFCVGNIIGPQLFFEWQAPTYSSGFLGLITCLVLAFVLCFVMRFYLILENSNRDKHMSNLETHDFNGTPDQIMVNLMDKTDKELPQFRYVY